MPDTPSVQILAAALFGLALIHTCAVKLFERLSSRYPRHAGLFHLLGEIEVVFGFWAIVLVLAMALLDSPGAALSYAESRQYTEPLFVFVVMVVAGSRAILQAISVAVDFLAKRLPVNSDQTRVWLCLAGVPMLGSLITEPAAMTIAALTLAPLIFRPDVAERAKYLALGVLFVNISIGGTLTSFAAPPVLMVAATLNWDSQFMAQAFGWKATLAVLLNATLCTHALKTHLGSRSELPEPAIVKERVPPLVVAIHFAFLASVVLLAHHPVAFLAVFLMFVKANGGGALVNVLSVASWVNGGELAAYSASKSAAWSLTNALRNELAPQKTQVVALHMGYVDTDLTRELEAPKSSPVDIVRRALDGLEAGVDEVLADELTAYVKRGMTAPRPSYLPQPT